MALLHRGPWALGPTAVERRPAGHLTVGHPRAGHQPVEPQRVGIPVVEQVRMIFLFIYFVSRYKVCQSSA